MVKESTKYESLIGVKEKPNSDLSDFLPELDEIETGEPWKKHWKEMPEFENDANHPYKTIQLHFRTQEDYEEFCRKYKSVDDEMTFGPKIKSMWYPKMDKTNNSLLRWIEDES